MMTPNDIEILIHCHVSGQPHPRLEAPAVQDSLAHFEQAGMIVQTQSNNVYSTTPGGQKLMEMLCDTPFPKEEWFDPREGISSEEKR